MLKKINRMGKNKEFDRAFKIGQTFYSSIFSIKAVNNDLAVSRLGVLISTKVSKKAVIRNHFKRQIREIIQANLPALKNGNDVVIVVFPQIIDKKFKEIEVILETGLKKLDLYK